MHRRRLALKAANVAGVSWLLSWFALYLEIFRYRHVVPSEVASVLWPARGARSMPGGFVRSVVAFSILAPLLFAALRFAPMLRRARLREREAAPTRVGFSVPVFLATFGVALVVLGAINQLIRRPPVPIVIDLTLRSGNGGFIVLGSAFAVAGIALRLRMSGHPPGAVGAQRG